MEKYQKYFWMVALVAVGYFIGTKYPQFWTKITG